MAQTNPDVFDVGYTHPARAGRSPARIVRYLTKRPLDRERSTREAEWRTLPRSQLFGDPETFREAADRRTRELKVEAKGRGKDLSKNKSARCCSYLHVVLSPSRRAEFSDRDFGELLEPWVKAQDGRELPFFAAIHREGEGRDHLHLLLARDKVERKRELPRLKERTAEIICEIERELDMEKELDAELEFLEELQCRRGRERGGPEPSPNSVQFS